MSQNANTFITLAVCNSEKAGTIFISSARSRYWDFSNCSLMIDFFFFAYKSIFALLPAQHPNCIPIHYCDSQFISDLLKFNQQWPKVLLVISQSPPWWFGTLRVQGLRRVSFIPVQADKIARKIFTMQQLNIYWLHRSISCCALLGE